MSATVSICIYHVQYKNSKKIVRCKKNDISDSIAAQFNISDAIMLSQWDNEFEDWVDVDDVNELPNKAKLLVKGQDDMFSSFSEPHSTSISTVNSVTPTLPTPSDEEFVTISENNPLASSPQSSNQDSTIPPLVRIIHLH
ncbi:uncharacterized protein LOC144742432 isoform X2 [Ciona intestinalis]